MDWLLVGGFGIMWAAFLLPLGWRRDSPTASVEAFERDMELLAETEQTHDGGGRWMVAPKKGARFLGPQGRAQARARERRRRVLVFLLEGVAFSFLIGIAPPLRATWVATGVFAALLAAYVWLLIAMREQYEQERARLRAAARPVPRSSAAVRAPVERFVADGRSRWPRPTVNGLGSLGEGDRVHVVILPASETVGELHAAGV